MKKRRIFIAINLPENIKKSLAGYREKWPELPAKWTKQDNIHITLIFLGYISDEKIPGIYKVVKETVSKYSSFDINLIKVCYDSVDKKPPRMVWALGQENKELSSLKKDLDRGLGISENRRLRTHITLARIRKWDFKKIEPEERLEIEEDINLSFPVNSIEIMESVLKRTGPKYTILDSVRLEGT